MIFLTGGTGLVGRHLLEAFQSRGTPVRALIRRESQAGQVRRWGAEAVVGRVQDPALWRAVGECSAIVHAAAMITARASWDEYEAVNVASARMAATRARELGVPAILISSVAVYGPERGQGGPESLEESSPFGPLDDPNMYARSKRLGERAFWEGAAGSRAAAFRPCVIYGEGDRQFLPRVMTVARSGFMPLFGREFAPLALVHARHIAQGVWLRLQRADDWGRAYNLVDPWPITAPEFVAAVGRGLGRKVRPVRIPLGVAEAAAAAGDFVLGVLPGRMPSKLSGVIRYWRGANPFSARAARESLGWSPDRRPEHGIPAAVSAIQQGE